MTSAQMWEAYMRKCRRRNNLQPSDPDYLPDEDLRTVEDYEPDPDMYRDER